MQNLSNSKRSSGFTLLELIVSIGIISIISLSLVGLVTINNRLLVKAEGDSERLLDEYYGLEFIKNEIYSADYLIPISLTTIPKTYENIGYVIGQVDYNENTNKSTTYKQILYWVHNNRLIRSVSEEENVFWGYGTAYQGNNIIFENITNIENVMEDKTLKLSFTNSDGSEFDTTIKIRCKVYEEREE